MSSKITVIKFGGSVLRDEDDLPKAVHEIYRHWRQGERVLAVVSAFGGTTDKLFSRLRRYGDDVDPNAVASFLYTGEATAASLLSLAISRAGIPVKLLSPEQAGIRTIGDPHDAEPNSADRDRIGKELENSVVVLSGFVGTDEAGNLTLLGRGGTDLTALFLADQLDARCRLIKDVDGLYEFDPASNGNRPHRFSHANYETALGVGGELIQPKAIRFARSRKLYFELAAFGSVDATIIGDFADRLCSDAKKRGPLRVALLGCGVVGGGVYARLNSLPELFGVVGVANLHPEKARALGIEPSVNTQSARALIERDCDVVIELIGGIEPAYLLIKRAIQLGRHVVTANKALIAAHGHELEKLASQNNVTLSYSAAVGGVMPALETVRRLADDEEICSVTGIVNGTCNFICDRLNGGVDFDVAVKEAQEAGFAEADPSLDLNGTDAAQKLILLAKNAFDICLSFESIDRVGIDALDKPAIETAGNRKEIFRLIATIKRNRRGIEASVKPVAIPLSHPFANIGGAGNCLLIETQGGKKTFIRGRGAGRYATAESVMADLFDLQREFKLPDRAEVTEISERRFVYENSNALCVAG